MYRIQYQLAFLMVLSFGLSSAQDCKTEIDPNTKRKIMTYLYDDQVVYSLNQETGNIKLYFQLQRGKGGVISKGSELKLFIQEKGSIIFSADKDIEPTSENVKGRKIYYWELETLVTKEELIRLSNDDILFITKKSRNGGLFSGLVNYEVKKRSSKQEKDYLKHIKKGANCILNYLE